MVDGEEESQDEAGNCGAHDRQGVRRLTDESKGEVCAVRSKCFRNRTLSLHAAAAAAAAAVIATACCIQYDYAR